MATDVTLGTNSGFVSATPTDSVSYSQANTISFQYYTFKVTLDTAQTISEMGWWDVGATSGEANYEVGIYSHNSTYNRPDSLLYSSTTNSKRTTTGWNKVTGLSWSLSAGTYWLAVQVDSNSPSSSLAFATDGSGLVRRYSGGSLASSISSNGTSITRNVAIYASYEEPPLTLSDSTTLTEQTPTVSKAPGTYSREVTDSSTLTDELFLIEKIIPTIYITDSSTLTDIDPTIGIEGIYIFNDNFSLYELPLYFDPLSRIEPVSLIEEVTITRNPKTFGITASDSLNHTDTIGDFSSSKNIVDYPTDSFNFVDTFNLTNNLTIPALSDSASFSELIDIYSIGTKGRNISETASLLESTNVVKVGEASGVAGQDTIYIKNGSGVWVLFEHFDSFKVLKRQNQMSEFEITIYDIQDAEKAYFKEFAEVLFMSGNNLILKGRIQTIDYGTDYEVVARGFGMEAKLFEKEFIKGGDKRYEYTNVSARTIVRDLLYVNPDNTSSGNILTPASNGIFANDYGNITMRFEYTNRLNALGAVASATNYEWWVSQSAGDKYAQNTFNMSTLRGGLVPEKVYNISGTGSNATRTSKERDITNMANYVTVLGFGDGENQLSTTCYAASTSSSTLSADITATQNTIALVDANSFPSSGTVRIMQEQITYTGKSGNTLLGCTRGANSTTAKTHKKGCYIERHYDRLSPQTGSPINLYGLVEYTEVDRTIIDIDTLELVASNYLIDHASPIERIMVIPDEPQSDVAILDVGDLVTVIDSEASINGNYRIVGIEYRDEYGQLSMAIELSNVSLEFLSQLQKDRQNMLSLQKYMQGATDTVEVSGISEATSADPQVFRLYTPNIVSAINAVNLRVIPSTSRDFSYNDGSSISFYTSKFPTNSKVHVRLIGPGGTITASGNPFTVSNGGTLDVDLTDEFALAGVGDWVQLEIIPTGSDITRMRLNSNLHVRYFLKNEGE